MQVNVYPWQQDIWQRWQQLLGQQRLHHAILLCAPKGSGKIMLAETLAKTILCKQQGTLFCGVCHSCQLFDAQTHPDFHCLKPEAPAKRIGVDQVRIGMKYAWETSQLGGQRLILIQDADMMGEAAANALLKTLEEPPSDCHFILLAESISRMLPTVVSRCNKWKTMQTDELVVKAWLESQLMQSVSSQVLRLHRGAPLAAKAFIESDGVTRHGRLFSSVVEYLTSKQGLFSLTEQLIKADREGERWLSFMLLDVIKLQQGTQEALVHCEEMTALSTVAKCVLPSRMMSQLLAFNQLQAQLLMHSGLNRELLISRWLSDFQ